MHNHLRLTTNRLLLNTQTVCFLLNVCYYYASLYAMENSYRALHLPICRVSAIISWISLCLATNHCIRDMSRGTWRLVALDVSWHSTLVAFHISWYFMPRVNQDSHGKFSNFTHDYLHVITRGLSCVCEVIVELYHSYMHKRNTFSSTSVRFNPYLGIMMYCYECFSFVHVCTYVATQLQFYT